MPALPFTVAMDAATRWSGLVGLMATETSTAPLASGGETRVKRGTGAFLSPAGSWAGVPRRATKQAAANRKSNRMGRTLPKGRADRHMACLGPLMPRMARNRLLRYDSNAGLLIHWL